MSLDRAGVTFCINHVPCQPCMLGYGGLGDDWDVLTGGGATVLNSLLRCTLCRELQSGACMGIGLLDLEYILHQRDEVPGNM